MLLLKQIIGGTGLVLASFSIPSLAQSGNSLAPVFRTDRTPTTYVCDGAFRFQVSWMYIDASPLISIMLPSNRSPQKSRTLLLPLSQSGSGMRYASDLASFHIKGEQATFTSVESVLSDEVRFLNCTNIHQTPAK